MQRRIWCGFFTVVVWTILLVVPNTARAGPLWYNGNYNGDLLDSLTNQGTGTTPDAHSYVLENFIVPVGATYTINQVFSNNLMTFYGNDVPLATSATWSINQGVSAGNSGTVIASGDSAATATLVAKKAGGSQYDEFNIAVTVPTPITLSAGTYWLSVSPDDSYGFGSAFQSYVALTTGAGAVGTPRGNDGNSFVSYGNGPLESTTAGDENGPGTWDFSMGVNGSTAAPEPSSIALAVCGLICLGGRAAVSWRSRRRQTVA